MNNKIIIAIIIVVSLGIFAGLAEYGWRYRYGATETYEVIGPQSLIVMYHTEQLALESADLFAAVWEKTPGIEVALMHQITERPWPKGLTEAVTVQAYHDGKDIYFKMTWKDDRANTRISLDEFTDSCAVAMPVDTDAPVRSIMMGFSSLVNIWHWQADKDVHLGRQEEDSASSYADFTYPFEDEEIFSVTIPELKSAVTDLLASRAGSLTRKDEQIVQGRGMWRSGTWSVVFKRSLITEDFEQDCQFDSGKRFASFAVWDGDQDDRGSRKSISEWVTLQIEPSQPKKTVNQQPLGTLNQTTQDTPQHQPCYIDKGFSFSLLSVAHAAKDPNQTIQTARKPRIIDIKAKRFEYTPSQITVKKGELITIRMESLDVTHGFYLDGYGINIKARPGLIGKATFLADKPGRFTFRCSETCGEFHPYMVGFLRVTPNSRFHWFVAGMSITFLIVLGVVLRGTRPQKGAEKNVTAE